MNHDVKTDKKDCASAPKCRKGLWLGFVLVLLWLPGFAWFYQLVPTPESYVLPQAQAEAIVVLTGAKGRLEEGLDLLQRNKGRVLFISGVGDGVKIDELAAVAGLSPQDLWLKSAVENGRIELGRVARSTTGNAQEVVEWMQKKQFTTMLLVTSYYHMPRSLVEMRAAMPNMAIIPVPVFPEDVGSDTHWFGNSLNNWRLIFAEYHKYMVRQLMLVLSVKG